VDHVDCDNGISLLHGPVRCRSIEGERWEQVSQARSRTMSGDALESLLIAISRLPGQMGERRCEIHGVFPGSAGNLQNGSGRRKDPLQNSQDRVLVAGHRRGCQGVVEPGCSRHETIHTANSIVAPMVKGRRIVADAARRSFDRRFSLAGSTALHKALGWDLLKAPANIALAAPQQATRLTAAGVTGNVARDPYPRGVEPPAEAAGSQVWYSRQGAPQGPETIPDGGGHGTSRTAWESGSEEAEERETQREYDCPIQVGRERDRRGADGFQALTSAPERRACRSFRDQELTEFLMRQTSAAEPWPDSGTAQVILLQGLCGSTGFRPRTCRRPSVGPR